MIKPKILYYLYSLDKCKLLLFFLILLIFCVVYFPSNNRFRLFKSNNFIIGDESYKIVSEDTFNYLVKNIKIHDFEQNNSCIPIENPIFWKNQTNLELEKLINQIKNRNAVRISLEEKSNFYKRVNPYISIIITLYNQDYYINTVYAFIQQQSLKDIEIIFVDDASTDNCSIIIKELMKFDQRIIYIKNPLNKKQFYSINIGVLFSKGEYILSIDPDDLLLNDILIKGYETAKYYNLDILQFYMISGFSLWTKVKYKEGIICNNENIRKIYYYGMTRNLPDKLIRRNIFLKSISFMRKDLFYMDYHIHTDDTIFFGIIHFARSYGFLEQIGYFYNQDPKRNLINNIKKEKIIKQNEDLKSLFNIMKYFFLQSDNNEIEKNNIPLKFFEQKVAFYLNIVINNIFKEFDFYVDVLNLYLNCSFFSKDKKEVINKYKAKIINKSIERNNKNYKF